MRRTPRHHFLIHTFAHVASVFAVLAVAVVMGVIGKTHDTPAEGMLAQTSGGSWVDLSETSTDALPAVTEVFFSAQPGPIARCDTGSPLTPVFFLVTKADGGDFLISSDTGMNNARIEWGEHPLPNGTYTWSASVHSGYIGAGVLHGGFVIDNRCPPLQSSVSPPSFGSGSSAVELFGASSSTVAALHEQQVTTLELKDPETVSTIALPHLRLFVDNKPVQAATVFDRELLELRVTSAASAKVSISAIDRSGSTTVLGFAEKDDLLSKVGVDVWTYEYDMKRSAPGVHKIFAAVTDENGTEVLSERTSIEVRHDVGAGGGLGSPSSVTTATSATGVVMTNVRVSSEEKRAILDRISDPASCTNEEECRIYCNTDLSEVYAQCLTYGRQHRDTAVVPGQSLADGVDPARIALLLGDRQRRPKDLPELVRDPEEFRQYCANMANADVCTKALVRNDMGRPDTLLARKLNIIGLREEEMKTFAVRVGARAFIDADNDGVTDFDEVNIYRTDPDRIDTDGDGFPDGAELLARTNPRGGERFIIATTSDERGGDAATGTERTVSDESIRLESPLIAGVSEPELLSVRGVLVAELGMDESGSTTIKKLKIEGRAPANSFVTVYIFSDPIVVTVKADANGAWAYFLDKQLESGTHRIYGAINDESGHIIAKSEMFSFVKEAVSISLSGDAVAVKGSGRAPLFAMIAVLVGIFGVILSIAGFIERKKADSRDGVRNA